MSAPTVRVAGSNRVASPRICMGSAIAGIGAGAARWRRLLRVYARCVAGLEDVWLAAMNAALRPPDMK
jgi:hypothetical protein